MSADNFIGVYQNGDDWVVCHGFMSPLMDSESPEFAVEFPGGYWGNEMARHPSRGAALVAAHDALQREAVVEYGVIELSPRGQLTADERQAVVARIEGSQTFERLPNYKALLASARLKLLSHPEPLAAEAKR